MSLRIAREQSLYASNANASLATLRRDLAGLQEQLATGLRVNRPSDDPSAYAQARMLESLDQRYAQYGRAIGDARQWVNQTGNELGTLTERFTEAYEEGLRALNGTLNDDNREALAGRIESLLAEVVDGLNAKSGGEYLFAGNRSTTEPFAEDGTPTGNVGGDRRRTIGPSTDLVINVSGERVLDTGEGFTITESLQNMIAALRGDDTVSLDAAVGQVIVARDHLIDVAAESGAVARRLDNAELQIQDASIEANRRRAEIEEVDYVETITRFQQAQTTLEAALRTTASAVQTTLLDYLR